MAYNNRLEIKGGVLAGYNGEEEIVFIPEGVKEIGACAFNSCHIKRVFCPDSLKRIGFGAFQGCDKLKEIVMPEDVIIEDMAFDECHCLADENGFVIKGGIMFGYFGSKTDIELPESIRRIGVFCFQNCKYLKSIVLPSTVIEIGAFAFSGCSNLISINITEYVEKIGRNAFQGCYKLADEQGFVIVKDILFDYVRYPLQSKRGIDIPKGVAKIDSSAFKKCSCIESVFIPKSVKEICTFAFYGCTSLKRVIIQGENTVIGEYTFKGCCNLTELNISNELTNIKSGAFKGCSVLSDEQGFVIINNILFDYFGKEEYILIPDGVTKISYNAFHNNGEMISISIPESVVEIDERAIYACEKLTKVKLPSDMAPESCMGAIRGCPMLKDKDGFLIIDGILFQCPVTEEMDEQLIIPDNVKAISTLAFFADYKSVIIPDSVEKIHKSVMDELERLENVRLPESYTVFGESYEF